MWLVLLVYTVKPNNSDKQKMFLDAWLSEPVYQMWLSKVKGDNIVAN